MDILMSACLQWGLNEFLRSVPDYSEVREQQSDESSCLFSNALLREAIAANRVTCPAQLPVLIKGNGSDMQERIARLYFIHGWRIRQLRKRYGLSRAQLHNALSDWRIRAFASGYIQQIDLEAAETGISESEERVEMELRTDRLGHSSPHSDVVLK